MKSIDFKEYIIIFLLGIIVCFYLYTRCYTISKKDSEKYINSITDSLSYYKNKKGETVATISVIKADVETLEKLKVQDVEIIKLQNLVQKYKKELSEKGIAIVTTTTTGITETIPVKEIINQDRFYDINLDNWVVGSAISYLDSLKLDLKIKNEYEIVVGERREKLLQPKKMFVDIINKNPYSETTSLRTFSVKKETDNVINIGIGLNYGITNDFKIQPTLGIGIYYSIYKF